MKRLALSILLGVLAIPLARGADQPLDDLFKQAQAAMPAGKFDDALQLYEKVFVEHPEANDHWYDAQVGITQALIKKGDFAGAAKSAHLCLDGASSPENYDRAVGLTAGILSAQDKNVDRANRFIAFQQSGTGTNPMDAVGYPSLPQREAAFATFRKQAGDDQVASRFRAMTYLFTGQPKEALAQYADAYRRADDNPNQLPQRVSELIGVGLRAARGHGVGLDEAVQFVVWGPNGPDGKPGTADDLADPFATLLSPVPAPGEGGLAELSAGDIALLQKVQAAEQLYAGANDLPVNLRNRALSNLRRVTNALDGWGAPGQEDWYRLHALEWSGPSDDEGTRGLLLHGAELAARGRGLNLEGAREFWNEIEAASAAAGLQDNEYIRNGRGQFDKLCAQISQIKFPPVDFKPLAAPATF